MECFTQLFLPVLVAHPDDETLWAGGTILNRPSWSWYITTLCRASDEDRAPKFFQALKALGAMGMLDTMIHGEPALLENVAQEIVLNEVILGKESGFKSKHKIAFQPPRIAEYRASVDDIANYLMMLMADSSLREKMGRADRAHVVERFDYRLVAKRFVQIIQEHLGIN